MEVQPNTKCTDKRIMETRVCWLLDYQLLLTSKTHVTLKSITSPVGIILYFLRPDVIATDPSSHSPLYGSLM